MKKTNEKGNSYTTNVNVHIDYDKLAKSIVAAMEAKSPKKRENRRSKMMRFINGTFYITVAIVCIQLIVGIWTKHYPEGRYDVVTSIIHTIILGVGVLIMCIAQQESLDDSIENTDKHFSFIVQIITLVAAIAALLHK